jgi:hypothetical protein
MKYSISSTGIDNYLYDVTHYLMEHHGIDTAYRMASPLQYYLNTGRGSTQFLHKLLETKPYIIARILAKGGADSDIMDAIKRRIRY